MKKPEIRAKTVHESETKMVQIVLPNDTNPLGDLLGGQVMHWIDIAGAIAAFRHCRSAVVTASMDSLQFLHPIKMGEMAVIEAWVNRAFTTSLEVEVHVSSENLQTGKQRKTSTAYLTFVALDKSGKPHPIPPLKPVTAREKRRFRDALQRRKARLAARKAQA
jgi:acyl-CoA hydrolase